jgi:hypothetical protein
MRSRKSCIGRNRSALIVAAAAGLVSIGMVPTGNAAILQPDLGPIVTSQPLIPFAGSVSTPAVKSGDTFNIAVAGFNANNSGSFLTAAVDPVFGTTQTFTGDALGGQTLTVTSSEVVGATTTTDTISISVPTNFAPAGTLVGASPGGAVTEMEADLGGYNAGPDTLDFASNVSNATVTGDMIYSGGSFALAPAGADVFTNGGMSLATAEGVNAGGSNLSSFAIHEFDFSITYPNPAVPEPATAGFLLSVAGAALLRRKRV